VNTPSDRDHELLTVADAARRLRVSQATIWRWINAGRIRSYRVGPKSVRIRSADLDMVIRPARATVPRDTSATSTGRTASSLVVPALTDEERQSAVEILRQIDALRSKIAARREGAPLPDSTVLIREMRDKRTQHLLEQ
jgi:excisionase family DNA binding protein